MTTPRSGECSIFASILRSFSQAELLEWRAYKKISIAYFGLKLVLLFGNHYQLQPKLWNCLKFSVFLKEKTWLISYYAIYYSRSKKLHF